MNAIANTAATVISIGGIAWLYAVLRREQRYAQGLIPEPSYWWNRRRGT